jgi:cytoskeleton protein RodZ
MPEIGATLREARTRARIDIAEIETATKIRAKYLRALENEEWELLPGPTFVKTFLRTYAEALGLDAKLLVDEYKLRHERLADPELRPISPRTQAASGRGGRGSRGPRRAVGGGGRSPRGPITLILVLLVLGILAALGLTQDDERDRVATQPPSTTGAITSRTSSTPASSPTASKPKPKRRFASLKVLPTGDVNVCLRAKGRGVLLDDVRLGPGEDSRTFRSSRITISLGNNAARLRANGKLFRPPASSRPIGYAFTPTGRRRLPAAQQPTCG